MLKPRNPSSQPDPTKNKIDRHLRDINDTISEDDINNVNIPPITENSIQVNDGIIEVISNEENVKTAAQEKNKAGIDVPNDWNLLS